MFKFITITILIHALVAFAAPVRAEGFDELVAQARVKIGLKQLEDNADWPTMGVNDNAFAGIYRAWVAPANPSPLCQELLSWLGKDAATASLLHDLIGRLTPEDCARLALAALRWASPRPALAIISLGMNRFPKDCRLGYLRAKLLEECGEFSRAIAAHLQLLQTQEELAPPPKTDPMTGEYSHWMALRPQPVTEIGGMDSPLSFWLGVNIGYDDGLTSMDDREMNGSSSSFNHNGLSIAQMHYFIVPPNLESLRAACLSRLARIHSELPAADRSRIQTKLHQLVPALGPYFPMFQADAFRADWPLLLQRLKINPEDRPRILSLLTRFMVLSCGLRDVALEALTETTEIGHPTPELLPQALTQFRQKAPVLLLKEHARDWSREPVSEQALFCLQLLESTEPRADLAFTLPGSYSDLPQTLPPASLALIPRIDAMLKKWITALPTLPPVLRDNLITCRMECLGKLPDKTAFEYLAAQHPTVAKYDGEKPRPDRDAPPLKLPVPPASKELQAAHSMVEILLPSNRYRQFDHLMTEANLRLGTPHGSWERFDCKDAEVLGKLLALQQPHTSLEMARVAEAYHLIGRDEQARSWFDRAMKGQPTHHWIRYRSGINLLANDPARADDLLKSFPRPAVFEAYAAAAYHYHEAPNVNAAAMLNIAAALLRAIPKKSASDFDDEITGMFQILNAEPYQSESMEGALPEVDPWDTTPAPIKAESRPSIWSVAGGLTASQRKQHEQLCDQFLAYLRNRPLNTVGFERVSWVQIAARMHKRKGAPPQALADDCVRHLQQYIGSNQEAPYWVALTDDPEFPGPFCVVFEAWMKSPDKLRRQYVDVFKGSPNTNQIPALFDEVRLLKTCDDKSFPNAVIKYYENHPQLTQTPAFLEAEASKRQFLHFSHDFYGSPPPPAANFMTPPARKSPRP